MSDAALAPKVELHCHLEATLTPGLLDRLAHRHDRPDLRATADGAFHVSRPGYDLGAYLAGYDAGGRLLVDEDDFALAVAEHLDRLALDRVVYTELFWSPMVHLDDGVAYETQLRGLVAGIEQSRSGVTCRLVPAIDRERPVAYADALLDEILAHRHDLVVGLGLDYDELLGPAADFVDVFARARSARLGVTSHAGETASARSVLDSVELLGCTRIDHGYSVLADARVTDRCRDAGTMFTVSTRTMTLLAAWGAELAATPSRMWAAGLRVSPATDAPAHFGNTLTDEYRTLADAGADLLHLAQDSLDAAFLDDGDRASLRRRLSDCARSTRPEGTEPCPQQ